MFISFARRLRSSNIENMVNECTSSNAAGFQEFSVFSLANPICFGVLFVLRIYVYYVEYIAQPPDPTNSTSKPQYGIGALAFLKYFLGLGMANTFASAFLFYGFYYAGENGLQIACQSQAGFVGVSESMLHYTCNIRMVM